MHTILLLGELGKHFGKKFKMDVKNPAEAVRALCANFPTFQKYVLDSGKRNVFYKVLVGKQARTADELHNPSGKGVIKIVPVIGGAGGRGNPFTFIAAAVLIVASIALNVVFPGNPVSPYLMNAGIAMAISGVVQMLTPLPQTPKQEDRPDNKPSYIFNGAVNTTAQGYPVPVGYGRMIVGSAVISAGITVDELAI
jgi:predicted phage tail protein